MQNNQTILERAAKKAATTGNPRVFIPLHKGADGWMSREQFLKFYWPTLHEMMLALIDKGLSRQKAYEIVQRNTAKSWKSGRSSWASSKPTPKLAL
jgi:hypothetical protein